MTRALLVAMSPGEAGGPAALMRWGETSLLGRLLLQLDSIGVSTVTVVTRPEWRQIVLDDLPETGACEVADGLSGLFGTVASTAAVGAETLLIGHADIVAHTSVLEGVVGDPRVATGILSTGRNPRGNQTFRVRIDRGRVVAAESPYHAISRSTGVSLGLLKVAEHDLPALQRVALELAGICAGGCPTSWEAELASKVERWGRGFFRKNAADVALSEHLARQPREDGWMPDVEVLRKELDRRFESSVLLPARAASDDAIAVLTTGLVRSGVKLTSSYLRGLKWSRALSEADVERAARAMESVDEDKVLLDAAVKATDGFFTTFFVSPYSRYLARWAARRGLTPNQVTVFSMVLGVAAAAAFALGNRAGLVAGALLLQAAFTADCVDGQLARYTRQFSKFGAWLDSVFDRGKEYAVYAGLAVGAARTGSDGIWLLASAAIALQTVRHVVDFSYAATQHEELALAQQAPLAEPAEQPARALPTTSATPAREGPRGSPDDAADDDDDTGRVPDPQRRLKGVGRLGVRASVYFEQREWMKWAKRILVLPIGERFALISLTAALADARATFIALLVWGVVALTYTALGRVLRSLV
jgi:phosphatidylglycerophosphate synthase